MSGFSDITQIVVPRDVCEACHVHLRRVGRAKFEGFALWAGTRGGDIFSVHDALIPAQNGIKAESGVCVRVESNELHRINVWLYEHGYSVIAQLHSHPTEAYHSDTDDTFPIVTTVGGVSIVVPDFAQRPFELEECAVYRLMPEVGWVGLSTAEAASLIRLL